MNNYTSNKLSIEQLIEMIHGKHTEAWISVSPTGKIFVFNSFSDYMHGQHSITYLPND